MTFQTVANADHNCCLQKWILNEFVKTKKFRFNMLFRDDSACQTESLSGSIPVGSWIAHCTLSWAISINKHSIASQRQSYKFCYWGQVHNGHLEKCNNCLSNVSTLPNQDLQYCRDVQKPDFSPVFKNPNQTEAKRSNPKFRFLCLCGFSQTELVSY